MLKFAASFLIGILFINSRADLSNLSLFIILAAIIPILVYFFSARLFWPLLAGCLGVIYMGLHASAWQVISPDRVNQAILVTGQIAGLVKKNPRSQSSEFIVLHAKQGSQTVDLPTKLLLLDYDQMKWMPGEIWRLCLKIRPPRGSRNAVGFDFESWAYSQGIGGIATICSDHPARLLNKGLSLHTLRQKLSDALVSRLPSHLLGFAQALVVGDKSSISEAQWQQLRATGTNHLMAISGLHIGLIAALLYFLSSTLVRCIPPLCLIRPAAYWAAAIALIAALAYAALAGFAIPTQRALIMLAVILLNQMRQIPANPSQVLGWSLLLVLIWDPLASMSMGFWLSFIAVFFIYYIIQFRHQRRHKIFDVLRIQWAVSIGLLPFLIWGFSQFSIVAPVVNLIVVPMVSICVVPLLMLASLCLTLSTSVAEFIFSIAAFFLDWVWYLISGFASLSWSHVTVPYVQPLTLLGIFTGSMLLLAPRGLPTKSLAGVFFLPLFLPQSITPPKGELWLTLFDVGQGLALVLETEEHLVLYDTGPPQGRRNAAQNIILPYLQSQGRRNSDLMVVSHGDADHSSGAPYLRRHLAIKQVITGGGWHLPGADSCELGDQIQFGNLQLQVLSPEAGEPPGNNASCVLLVEFGAHRILLTGDIEYEAEYLLLTQDIRAQVLVVPHHGSRTSSSQNFIRAVSPQVALNSSGYMNRFAHPHEQVVKRYINNKVQLFDTKKDGAIRLRFVLGQVGQQREFLWQPRKRYWHSD